MPDVTLRWVGALDAVDATTKYKIQSDEAASGTFVDVVASQDATTPFAPVTTTLSGAIDDDDVALTFASAASYSNGDYVFLDKEMVLLAGKSSNTFATCTRGVGGTIRVSHLSGVTIYKAHESYTDTTVNYGTRYVVRYRVLRVQGSNNSVAAEIVAVNPPLPRSTSFCTLW